MLEQAKNDVNKEEDIKKKHLDAPNEVALTEPKPADAASKQPMALLDHFSALDASSAAKNILELFKKD